jgi:hypothetical protein
MIFEGENPILFCQKIGFQRLECPLSEASTQSNEVMRFSRIDRVGIFPSQVLLWSTNRKRQCFDREFRDRCILQYSRIKIWVSMVASLIFHSQDTNGQVVYQRSIEREIRHHVFARRANAIRPYPQYLVGANGIRPVRHRNSSPGSASQFVARFGIAIRRPVRHCNSSIGSEA